MPIFPFDDEEARRRRMLTPGINPDARPLPAPPWTPGAVTAMGGDVMVPEKPAGLPGDMRGTPPLAMGPGRPSSLPDVPNLSRPINAARPELDMTGAPSIIPKPQTRYGEMQEAKDVYLQKTPGRGKSALLGVLQGLGQGLASGGGLGAGLGGALAGGVVGGVNPRGLREQQFNQQVKPKILERFQLEDADRAQQAAAQKAQREDQAARAGILNTQSQIQDRTNSAALAGRKQEFEENQPLNVPEGTTAINRRTGKPVFTSPRAPKAPTDADVEQRLYDETGDTIETLSQKSLQGRIEAIKGRLTADERRLLGRPTDADDPQAVARAQSKWQKVQEDELNSIRRDTSSRVRAQYRGGQGVLQNATSPGLPKGNPKAAAKNQRRAISVQEAADLLK